jgi:hypothetical protein
MTTDLERPPETPKTSRFSRCALVQAGIVESGVNASQAAIDICLTCELPDCVNIPRKQKRSKNR